jgi:hypothetical protein
MARKGRSTLDKAGDRQNPALDWFTDKWQAIPFPKFTAPAVTAFGTAFAIAVTVWLLFVASRAVIGLSALPWPYSLFVYALLAGALVRAVRSSLAGWRYVMSRYGVFARWSEKTFRR